MKYVLIIFLYSNLGLCQKSILFSNSNVDSLIKDREYAIKNLLQDKNKYSLIKDLLNYQGNYNINPTWKLDIYKGNPEKRSSPYVNQATSNELIALFLIEGIIRDTVLFNGNCTSITILGKKGDYPKELRPYKEDEHMYYKDGSVFHKMLLNQQHIKKIFSYYKKWFNKIKSLKIPFEEIPAEYKNPLKNTNYKW